MVKKAIRRHLAALFDFTTKYQLGYSIRYLYPNLTWMLHTLLKWNRFCFKTNLKEEMKVLELKAERANYILRWI